MANGKSQNAEAKEKKGKMAKRRKGKIQKFRRPIPNPNPKIIVRRESSLPL